MIQVLWTWTRSVKQHQALDARIGVDLEVAAAVENDLVSGALKELALLIEHDVFAARLLITAMNQNDFHSDEWPFPAELPSGKRSGIRSPLGT
jgi:hypothetical protein